MDDPFDMEPEKSGFLGCCLWAAGALAALALPILGIWKLVDLIRKLF